MNHTVTVNIPYTIDTGEKLVNETFGPNNIRRRKTGSHELMKVEVRDGRLLADRLSLEQQGFVFVEHKTNVADFFDAEQLKSVYYPEVEELIKNASGASRVAIFDHTLRSGDESEREAKLIREPVLSAHNDYTEWSGPNRVREFLPRKPRNYSRVVSQSFKCGAQSISRSREIPWPLQTPRASRWKTLWWRNAATRTGWGKLIA